MGGICAIARAKAVLFLPHPSITTSHLCCQGDGAEVDAPLLTQTMHSSPHTPLEYGIWEENKAQNKGKTLALVKGSYHFNGSKR